MKRYVFNDFLKSVRLSQLLTWLGSWFHHLGPITLKALDANIFNIVLGSNSLFTILSMQNPCFLSSGNLTKRSLRYNGPAQSRHLNTRVNTLNCIHLLIGSQCSSHRHSEELWNLLFPNNNLAVIFCTLCIRDISEFGNPAKIELQ